jgi:hypothetical protein
MADDKKFPGQVDFAVSIREGKKLSYYPARDVRDCTDALNDAAKSTDNPVNMWCIMNQPHTPDPENVLEVTYHTVADGNCKAPGAVKPDEDRCNVQTYKIVMDEASNTSTGITNGQKYNFTPK